MDKSYLLSRLNSLKEELKFLQENNDSIITNLKECILIDGDIPNRSEFDNIVEVNDNIVNELTMNIIPDIRDME